MSDKCPNCEIYKGRIESAWAQIAALEARNEKLERIRDAAENLDKKLRASYAVSQERTILQQASAALEDKEAPDA